MRVVKRWSTHSSGSGLVRSIPKLPKPALATPKDRIDTCQRRIARVEDVRTEHDLEQCRFGVSMPALFPKKCATRSLRPQGTLEDMTISDPPEADPPDQFDEYEFVLLWSARDRVELEPDAALRLQRQHLGHLEAMRAAGHLLASGPLAEQPDPRLRGLCIYRTGSLERTRALATSDPAVKAGQLEIEAIEWRTRPGALPGSNR